MADLFTSAPAQVTPFTFGTHAVRVIDRDGSPWFVASDVCEALGYKNTSDAIATHLDDDERSTIANSESRNGGGLLTIISESGLYALVLRSRKPEARKFAKWVTSEVLPAIRKTGGYQQPVKMQAALDAANAVAAQVQRVVFEQLLRGDKHWQSERWMLSFHTGRDDVATPRAHQVEADAVVMTLPNLAIAIAEEGGMLVASSELAHLAAACSKRLAMRMGCAVSKKAVTA